MGSQSNKSMFSARALMFRALTSPWITPWECASTIVLTSFVYATAVIGQDALQRRKPKTGTEILCSMAPKRMNLVRPSEICSINSQRWITFSNHLFVPDHTERSYLFKNTVFPRLCETARARYGRRGSRQNRNFSKRSAPNCSKSGSQLVFFLPRFKMPSQQDAMSTVIR